VGSSIETRIKNVRGEGPLPSERDHPMAREGDVTERQRLRETSEGKRGEEISAGRSVSKSPDSMVVSAMRSRAVKSNLYRKENGGGASAKECGRFE